MITSRRAQNMSLPLASRIRWWNSMSAARNVDEGAGLAEAAEIHRELGDAGSLTGSGIACSQ
ncbi:hypothetical protein [Clavibacter michiganensis]|uniref:hypothetical protein n=1 Tax=Clavibacter michiganensis TaxID=28447 RepID=UPI001FB4CDF3|nr:hypothetical protein [Clavibacter michiganensis]